MDNCKRYKAALNPKDHFWYVVGYCGNGYWMPVSDGFKTKDECNKRMEYQYMADKDAIKLIVDY